MRSRVLSSFTLQQSCVLDPVEVLKMFVCVKCNMNRHLLVLPFSYFMCVTLAAPTLTVPQNESGVIYRTDQPVFLFHDDVGVVNGSNTGATVVGCVDCAKAGTVTQSPERKLLSISELIKDIEDEVNDSYTGLPVVGSAEAAAAVVGSAEAGKAVVGRLTQSPERKLLSIEESIKDIGDDIKTLVDVLTNFNGSDAVNASSHGYSMGDELAKLDYAMPLQAFRHKGLKGRHVMKNTMRQVKDRPTKTDVNNTDVRQRLIVSDM